MRGLQAQVRQRTFGDYGHFLNHRQTLSHCGRYLVYDTRNADPDISKTTRIESLDLLDDTVSILYDTHSQSIHGPGVGAAVCHPLRSTVVFIHGLTHCDELQPYAMTRRFGACIHVEPSNRDSGPRGKLTAIESRSLQPEIPWGVLGGGTHAHSFSSDGRWISFTYNDALAPEHRTVGIAIVDRWDSDADQVPELQVRKFEEEFQGIGWAAVILVPDQTIESAREECWLPHPTLRQLAFVGRIPIRTANPTQNPQERWIDEVFVAQLPEQADRWPRLLDPPLPDPQIPASQRANAQRANARVSSPPGIQVRRLTHTESAVHPGVQGPRHWLMASNCGSWIYTLMKDPQGTVRMVRVSVQDGQWEWISKNQESITHAPAIDSSTGRISYLTGKRLTILDTTTGQEMDVAWDSDAMDAIIGPVQFLSGSQGIFWNAKPFGSRWLQIWTAHLQ
ncbi:MAG: DUF3748 domain-containing protein [Planctomycetota bacterium]|nr:DUF3748 domain-containing protein [Planctomycetota bacterium]